jgi:hypothetical protein
MLIGTPQHLSAVRFDGQDGLQVHPTPVPIADFSQATYLAAMAQIQVRGVLDQQDERQALHVLACLLPMRLHQRIEGDIGFIEQSIHCFYIFPGLRLRWQRGSAILSHVSRGLHGSPCTAHVLELCLSKGRFGPLLRVWDFLRFHLSILPDCKMWVKDRPGSQGLSGAEFR